MANYAQITKSAENSNNVFAVAASEGLSATADADPLNPHFSMLVQIFDKQGYELDVAYAMASALVADNDEEFTRLKRENPLPAANNAEVPFHQDI